MEHCSSLHCDRMSERASNRHPSRIRVRFLYGSWARPLQRLRYSDVGPFFRDFGPWRIGMSRFVSPLLAVQGGIGMRKREFLRESTESPNSHLGDDVERVSCKNCAVDKSYNRLNLSGYECRQMSPNWLFQADLSPMNTSTRLHSVVRPGVEE